MVTDFGCQKLAKIDLKNVKIAEKGLKIGQLFQIDDNFSHIL
jgi:hypothetical protein